MMALDTCQCRSCHSPASFSRPCSCRLWPSFFVPHHSRDRYDLVITGGMLIDGTGAPRRRADVAIRDGRIAAIGTIAKADGKDAIDATVLVVAPGFIDVHTHADDLAEQPRAENFVRMGVTTIVAGNCGSSALDVGKALVEHRAVRRGGQLRDADRPQHRAARGDGHRGSHPDGERAREDEEPGVAGDGRRRRRVLDGPSVRARHLRQDAGRSSSSRAWRPMPAASTRRTCATKARRSRKPSRRRSTSARWPGRGCRSLTSRSTARADGARARRRWRSSTRRGSAAWSSKPISTPTRRRARGSSIRFPSWALEGGQPQIDARLNDPPTWDKIKTEMRGAARRARPAGSLLRRRRLVRVGSVAERAVDEAGRRQAARQRTPPTRSSRRRATMMLAGGASMVYHFMSDDDVERIMKHPQVGDRVRQRRC